METAPSNSKKRKLSGPVPFVDSHVSTKNRRISDVVDKHDSDAIIKAAIRIFQNRGHKNAAKALEILEENPNDFSNLHGFISEVENKKDKSPMMTPRQGLFHMLGMYTLATFSSQIFFTSMFKTNGISIHVHNFLQDPYSYSSTFLTPLTLYPLFRCKKV